jgi:ubiquinone/menaquinone biosynthesis C-methylase UbiE
MSDQSAEERFHFNRIASLYDTARPGYSSLLVDDLICLSKLKPGASVLDIGCGTGKSTLPFAQRGYKVCALDPGEEMMDICKRNLRAYANVRYELGSFETWAWSGEPFDLVVSGTAFHWVSEAAHGRLSDVLKSDGALGVFWHTFLNGNEPVYGTFNEIYKKHSPENYAADFAAAQEVFDRKREQKMLSLAGFKHWRVMRYYDYPTYDARRYVELMRTWSTHRNVDERLFEAVGSAINAAGGTIVKPVRTTVCLALRNGG